MEQGCLLLWQALFFHLFFNFRAVWCLALGNASFDSSPEFLRGSLQMLLAVKLLASRIWLCNCLEPQFPNYVLGCIASLTYSKCLQSNKKLDIPYSKLACLGA